MVNDIPLIKEEDIRKLIKSIAYAIGDDTKEQFRGMGISSQKSNSVGNLKWDLINRNIVDAFSSNEIVADYAKRGGWNMVPLVDKKNGYVYTIMREERFKEIQKHKRKTLHYMDAFVNSFNFDVCNMQQMSLFDLDSINNDEVKKIVNQILKDMNVDNSIIRRYATILFKEYESELISVRCCILDTSLRIIYEEDWSKYIVHEESVIVENNIDGVQELTVGPTGLKAKAKARLGRKDSDVVVKGLYNDNSYKME